jgi:hypothetical protein
LAVVLVITVVALQVVVVVVPWVQLYLDNNHLKVVNLEHMVLVLIQLVVILHTLLAVAVLVEKTLVAVVHNKLVAQVKVLLQLDQPYIMVQVAVAVVVAVLAVQA